MTNDEKKTIKESIIKQIDEFEADIILLKEAAKPIAPDDAYGRVSRMDAINNKAIVDASLKDKEITVRRFKYTLSKIDSEDYGKCSRCGNYINLRRLMSIPYVNLCISCANKFG
jgi:DnaK suppressor protein